MKWKRGKKEFGKEKKEEMEAYICETESETKCCFKPCDYSVWNTCHGENSFFAISLKSHGIHRRIRSPTEKIYIYIKLGVSGSSDIQTSPQNGVKLIYLRVLLRFTLNRVFSRGNYKIWAKT